MEATGLFRLTTCKVKTSDIFLWKYGTKWDVGQGSVKYKVYTCPMKRRFGCNCELKIGRSEDYVTLEKRGTHDRNSHAPDKDQSKFLKLAQIDSTGSTHGAKTNGQASPAQSSTVQPR